MDALAAGRSPLDKPEGGILVLHLIPRSCAQGRCRFDGAKLKEHGGTFPALGEGVGYSRFNVDGLLNYDGREQVRAYSQLFRDGRLEAHVVARQAPRRGGDRPGAFRIPRPRGRERDSQGQRDASP